MEKNQSLPPLGNTGVESTKQIPLKPCVDWLQATFKTRQDSNKKCAEKLEKVYEILGLSESEFLPLKNGKYGYKHGMAFQGNPVLAVYYDGAEDMGIHIEMTGQGCRLFELHTSINWYELFYRLVYEYEVNITRLDVAVDDFEGYFNIRTLVKKLKDDEVTSRFKKARHIENIVIEGGETVGHTLYFGASSSDIQIRFYEKNVQMGMDIDVWNRTELQLRDGRAYVVAQILADDVLPIGEIVAGVLRNYIQFRTRKATDKNKKRWPLARFWLNFLGDVQPLRIAKQMPKTSIEKKYQWIDTQVSKSFFMIYYCLTEEEKQRFIDDILTEGSSKLTKSDLQIIEMFKSKHISYDEMIKIIKRSKGEK